jgi:uncharacterized protein (TIGR03067 family)
MLSFWFSLTFFREFNMRKYGVVVLALGLLVGAGKAKAEDKTDKDKIQGSWSLVTLEENGESQKVAEDSDKYIKLKIDADKFQVTLSKGEHEAIFKVDSSKKPKTIDLTLKGGDEDGKEMKGFYELDGDTLKICIGSPEHPDRPAEFKSKDEIKVFTFKRVKK